MDIVDRLKDEVLPLTRGVLPRQDIEEVINEIVNLRRQLFDASMIAAKCTLQETKACQKMLDDQARVESVEFRLTDLRRQLEHYESEAPCGHLKRFQKVEPNGEAWCTLCEIDNLIPQLDGG